MVADDVRLLILFTGHIKLTTHTITKIHIEAGNLTLNLNRCYR